MLSLINIYTWCLALFNFLRLARPGGIYTQTHQRIEAHKHIEKKINITDATKIIEHQNIVF